MSVYIKATAYAPNSACVAVEQHGEFVSITTRDESKDCELTITLARIEWDAIVSAMS